MIFGIAAMVLAAQLWGGFPPFYRRFGSISEVELRRFLPHFSLFAPLFVALAALKAGWVVMLIGAVGLWCWWRIRQIVAQTAPDGPRFVSIWPIFAICPMLVFDLWTLGWAAGFAAL